MQDNYNMVKLVKPLSFVIIISICLASAGCARETGSPESAADKLTVAVSIVPQETFVKAVAGDLVNVVTLIPPGKSAESYQPTPREMEAFARATLYFSIGVPVEDASILPRVKDLNSKVTIVPLADRVREVYPDRYFEDENVERHEDEKGSHDEGEEHRHEGRDPHIWLSPKRVKVMIEVIAKELSAVDAANKSIYEKNAKEYIAKLDKLDEYIRSTLSGVKNRTFIVFHPAYGYFADDYGLKMLALEKDGKEATARNLEDIIDIAKKENIKAIFYQAEVDSKQTRTLAAEIGGKAVQLAPLHPDYIENMKRTARALAGAPEQ